MAKQYKLYYKKNWKNEKIVLDLIIPMLQKYQPPIHVPLVIKLLMNSFDYDTFEHYTRETVVMPDGEEIALDWYPKHYKNLPEETPVVIVVPGVNSDSRASYARDYATVAYERHQYRTAVFCRRGQSRMPFVYIYNEEN